MEHHLLIAAADRAAADELSVAGREAGFEVTALDHRADLIRQADVLLPSAIVLAADFDGGAGWAVCNQLKTHPVLKRIPLLLTLAGPDAQARADQHEDLATRADAYLVDPTGPEAVLSLLEPLLPEDRQTHLEEMYRLREQSPPPTTMKSALLWLVLLFALVLTGVLFFYWRG